MELPSGGRGICRILRKVAKDGYNRSTLAIANTIAACVGAGAGDDVVNVPAVQCRGPVDIPGQMLQSGWTYLDDAEANATGLTVNVLPRSVGQRRPVSSSSSGGSRRSRQSK